MAGKDDEEIVMTLSMSRLRTVTLASVVLALAGCASSNVQPGDTIAQAETSIRQAEQNDAARHSAAELDMARQKLNGAQDAMRAEQYELADRLAQQASADAELAAALARTSETEAAAEEIQATIAALRSEATGQ
jgi:hypothetical protein